MITATRFPARELEAITRAVNERVAPVVLEEPFRHEGRFQIVWPARWGVFRFRIAMTIESLLADRQYDLAVRRLEEEVTRVAHNAFADLARNHAETLLDAKLMPWQSRIERLERDRAALEQRVVENEALLNDLLRAQLAPWHRRLWRAIVFQVQRLRRRWS